MFVQSTANDLGTGRLISVDGTDATVEYFLSPNNDGVREVHVGLDTLNRIELEPHSRVFLKTGAQPPWSIATLVWHLNENARLILPGGAERNVSASSIYVLCNRTLCDPTVLLANQICESATYAYARRRFLTLMTQQRIASGGIHCLLSSAVDLEHHQIEVVRRVLRDPIQRYLLGDEVGLGKTIEAGLLIRQHIHDNPLHHLVLIIVPKALKQQWKSELRGRFGLDSELQKTVRVVDTSKLGEIEDGFCPTMVVIDEAHQVAALYRGSSDENLQFEAIRRLALLSPRLLMLTATPLLHNERDYLTMLHLLDPEIYQPDDIDGFKTRVVQRQTIAEACFTLSDKTPNDFLSDAVQQIQVCLPSDPLVQGVASKLFDLFAIDADENNPERKAAIIKLRTHLSEVYRLHRRLLRNRRVGELKAVTPGRGGVNRVVYFDPHLPKLFEALEQWRQSVRFAAKDGFPDEYVHLLHSDFEILLTCCLECGFGLKTFIEQRLASSAAEKPAATPALQFRPVFDDEKVLLGELSKLSVEVAKSDARVRALTDHIAKNPENATHWVIFCSDSGAVDVVCSHLKSRFGESAVWRHNPQDAQWRKFHFANPLSLLVCDRSAEEGLNLQGRDAVLVHFDLPFSPGRIEQRMGRLDRFGKGNPVLSVLLCSDESPWEDAWLSFMNEGLGAFRDSIASLQYSTAEWIRQGLVKSFEIGPDSWTELAARLGGEQGLVAQELRRIEAQDAMDNMDLSEGDEGAMVERLRALETPEWVETFSDALLVWGEKALSLKKYEVDRERPGIFRLLFSEDWTLIPKSSFLRHFGGAVDGSFKPPVATRDRRVASRPMSFKRREAQERRSLVARYGETFLDALYEFTLSDDRGTSFALWRYRRNMPVELQGAYVQLNFVVEAEVAGALATANGVADPFALRREADAMLPPILQSLWLDKDHEPVAHSIVLAMLSEPLRPPMAPGQDGDFDLDRRLWPVASREAMFQDWGARLRMSLQVGRGLLAALPEVTSSISKSKDAAEARLRHLEFQMNSRLSVLPVEARAPETEQFQKELAWRKALLASIEKPRIRVDSAGVVVLDRRGFR